MTVVLSRENNPAVDLEVNRVHHAVSRMIEVYCDWGGGSAGEIHQALYTDILDYVNFRVETAETCLLLIQGGRIADALGLNRSLLENYLLFMLMCRGRKYFLLEDLTSLRPSDFKEKLRKMQQELRDRQERGEATVDLELREARRIKRHVMHVREGLVNSDEPDFVIPVHYFQFQQFRPEVMRLDREDYFEYFEESPETRKALKEYRKRAEFVYRNYLSYDALLECLELNDLVDAEEIKRIQAHYTFLGEFLHPTHNAARGLHLSSNVRNGATAVGMGRSYSNVASLLASLYTCYSLAGLLAEAANLIETAPSKYISDPRTMELRRVVDAIPRDFPYFWFLFNSPPLYDRFNYCVHHATDAELAEWGDYSRVPSERVPFDQYVLSHLESALGGWSNSRCGQYRSPLEH